AYSFAIRAGAPRNSGQSSSPFANQRPLANFAGSGQTPSNPNLGCADNSSAMATTSMCVAPISSVTQILHESSANRSGVSRVLILNSGSCETRLNAAMAQQKLGCGGVVHGNFVGSADANPRATTNARVAVCFCHAARLHVPSGAGAYGRPLQSICQSTR